MIYYFQSLSSVLVESLDLLKKKAVQTYIRIKYFPILILRLAREIHTFNVKYFISLKSFFFLLHLGICKQKGLEVIQNGYKSKLKLISNWAFCLMTGWQLYLPVSCIAEAAHTYNTDMQLYTCTHVCSHFAVFLPFK